MVVKHLSSRAARANFADLLGSVFYTNEAVIIEKKGKPVAVVISPTQYQALQEAIVHDWAVIDALQARNADKDPEEVLTDVTAAVEEVRRTGRRGVS
jgi:prevent-host-death family protein